MSKLNNLSGKTFNFLTVISRHPENTSTGRARWICQCKCGNSVVVAGNSLLRENTTSCGCYRPDLTKDYSGQRFGWLLVVRHHSVVRGASMFVCKCDCGEDVVVSGNNLKRGDTKSCGCYRTQCLKGRSTIEGTSKRKEYICWCSMRDRVKNNMYYIKKGRKVCEGYNQSYHSFIADIGYQPKGLTSVDRIDNDGHYSCGKCRECMENGWNMNVQWANAKMQSNNTSKNRMFTYKGERKSVSQWAQAYGIKRETLYYRLIKFHWPIEKALTSRGKLANKPKGIIFE